MKAQHAEVLDLVDANGTIIGQELKSIVHARGIRNYRVVDIFLKNPEGKFFICKRAKKKKIHPGTYESCGEHVLTGESDLAAARRGIKEEFGLDIPSLHFEFVGYTTFLDGASGHVAVFMVTSDEEPKLSQEHEHGMWVTPEQISSMLRENPLQFRSNILRHFAKHARILFPESSAKHPADRRV